MRDVWDGIIPKIIALAQQEVDNVYIQDLLEGTVTNELSDGEYNVLYLAAVMTPWIE